MPGNREFFNTVEEFDESKHLSAREIWDGLAKSILAYFGDMVSELKMKDAQQLEELAKIKEVRRARGMTDEEVAKEIHVEEEHLNKRIKAFEDYQDAQLEEQSAMAMRNRDSKNFLEKRKALTRKQEELIKTFKDDFLKEIDGSFEILKDKGVGWLKDVESRFAAADGGILPVKKWDNKNRQVHPDFTRMLDKSALGSNVLNEGIFKILKQEREAIDEQMYSKKERSF